MKNLNRLKVCSNCSGKISTDSLQCPYCFTVLQPSTSQETYSSYSSTESSPQKKINTNHKIFLPTLLLTVGGNLFVLGLLQFIFSDRGVLRLEINSNYWFLLLIISLPLFYFGLKTISEE
jgi:hypothetical protein